MRQLFLQALTVISEAKRPKWLPQQKCHFTVNDVCNSALARYVVIWMLLEQLASLEDADED
jgi:hypothetical protein